MKSYQLKKKKIKQKIQVKVQRIRRYVKNQDPTDRTWSYKPILKKFYREIDRQKIEVTTPNQKQWKRLYSSGENIGLP